MKPLTNGLVLTRVLATLLGGVLALALSCAQPGNLDDQGNAIFFAADGSDWEDCIDLDSDSDSREQLPSAQYAQFVGAAEPGQDVFGDSDQDDPGRDEGQAPDAGTVDAATADAGAEVDAGVEVDASAEVDASVEVDASAEVDASVEVDASAEVDAGELEEEEPIVIACGDTREFPISGEDSASRTTTIKKRYMTTLVTLPSPDEVTRICRATKQSLCYRVMREAKQGALNNCRKNGREIAAAARCEETEQCDPTPQIKKLQCAVVDPPKDCDWSSSLSSDKSHRIRANRKFFDRRTGRWRDVCGGSIRVRDVVWECRAEVRYVTAEGSVILSCPEQTVETEHKVLPEE